MLEKRSLKRRDLYYNCKVTDAETGECIGYAVDFSTHGLKISSSNDFNKGQRLELSIELPEELLGRQNIRFVGMVRWCTPDVNPSLMSAGIQIASIAPRDSEAIVALMAQFSTSLS